MFFVVIVAGRVLGPASASFGSLAVTTGALLTGGVGPLAAVPDDLRRRHRARGRAAAGARGRGRTGGGSLAAYALVTGLAFGVLMNLWFWPFLGANAPTGMGFVPGATVTENLGHYGLFYLATSLGWDLPRGVLNAVLVVVAGPALLRVFRRGARRAAFGAPVAFEPAPRAALTRPGALDPAPRGRAAAGRGEPPVSAALGGIDRHGPARRAATTTLVTGPVRSGKSRHAEHLVGRLATHPGVVTYVATGRRADPSDPEWSRRVADHRARRRGSWRTVETTDVVGALAAATGPVLVDCLGTWLTAVVDDGLGPPRGRRGRRPTRGRPARRRALRDDRSRRRRDERGRLVARPHDGIRAALPGRARPAQRAVAAVAAQVHLVVAGRVLDLTAAPVVAAQPDAGEPGGGDPGAAGQGDGEPADGEPGDGATRA